jgi:hypothetical protein
MRISLNLIRALARERNSLLAVQPPTAQAQNAEFSIPVVMD